VNSKHFLIYYDLMRSNHSAAMVLEDDSSVQYPGTEPMPELDGESAPRVQGPHLVCVYMLVCVHVHDCVP
jgi:hypothetical protein